MIVLDASVLIAQLSRDDAQHERALRALRYHAGHRFLASPLTIAEVLVNPARADRIDDTLDLLSDLGVMERPLPADSARRLARLRAATGLRLPDCCVLLAAEDAAAEAILTFDDRLAAAARQRGIAVR